MPGFISSALYLVHFALRQLEALIKPFLWPPLSSFLTCCTRLDCTMALVSSPDPSHRICTSYVNLQKESKTDNELPSHSFRKRQITFPTVMFFDSSVSYIILPGSMTNKSRKEVTILNETTQWKNWQAKNLALVFSCYSKKLREMAGKKKKKGERPIFSFPLKQGYLWSQF